MRVDDVVRRMGGTAGTSALVRATSRRRVRTALRRGLIVRDADRRISLPTASLARRGANRLCGVVTDDSAAAHWHWEMKYPPSVPTVTVPRNRRVSPERREGLNLKWRDIPVEHVWRQVTTHGATVIDCARSLPFDEALAIADSALRHGDVTPEELLSLAEQVASTGRSACLRVARHADGRSDNPSESVLRAISLDVPGLSLVPQVEIREAGWAGRPDLVDERLRIAAEAESFEFHGGRKALTRDCERYNALVVRGWVVLRFTWEQVMFHPEYVAECLRALVVLRTAAVDGAGRRKRRRRGPARQG